MSAYFNVTENRNFMKKLFLMIAVMLTAITTTFAQTVVSSSFFENTYIGIGGGTSGVISPKINGFDNFAKSMGGLIDLRLGKNITPKFGIEMEGTFHLPSSNAHSNTKFDFMTIGINGLFNVNNMIHGYKGHSDKVEFVPFVGAGWQHQFTSMTLDDFYTKGGFQVNWNLSEAWQINLIPSIKYRMTNNGNVDRESFSTPYLNANRAEVSFVAGITYKFKNRKGTHNFVLCPYKFTQEDLDNINEIVKAKNEEINTLNKLNDSQSKIISAQEELIKELKERKLITEETNIFPVVGFEIGKDEINSTHKASLIEVAKYLKENENKTLTIFGHADSQTGTEKRNMELSINRAKNVKKELVNMGVKESQVITFGKGSTDTLFEENDSNRAAIFVLTK